jgi:hypothetical protein
VWDIVKPGSSRQPIKKPEIPDMTMYTRTPSDSLLSSTRSQSISTSTLVQEKVNKNGNTYREAVQDYTFKKREYKEESAGLQALVKQINKTVDPHHMRLYCKAEEEVKD